MKVLFLDFDGVLNSAASFLWEKRKKTLRIQDTLSPICASNLQFILERDRDIKVVISSTWRRIHTLVELKNVLDKYGVFDAKIISQTPMYMDSHRGREIRAWLDDNPNVTKYAILDDDINAKTAVELEEGVIDPKGRVFLTTWEDGLSMSTACQVSDYFRGPEPKKKGPDVDMSAFII